LAAASLWRWRRGGRNRRHHDVSEARGKDVVGELNAAGSNASAGPPPLSSTTSRGEEDWQRVIAEIRKAHGRLDVLVNMPGIFIAGYLTEFSLRDVPETLCRQCRRRVPRIKHSLPLMAGEGWRLVDQYLLHHSAHLDARARGLCLDQGGRRPSVALRRQGLRREEDGIRVNSILPGVDRHARLGRIAAGQAGPHRTMARPSRISMPYARRSPWAVRARRTISPKAVVFLASDESRYITGIEMAIDGGSLLR